MKNIIISVVASVVVVFGVLGLAAWLSPAPEFVGAPISNIFRSVIPAEDDLFFVGTTSPSNLRYKGRFTDVTITDLTVSGTCTGCSAGASTDLQDTYNNSAADAQILTTTGKDIVFFLTNTDSNATVQILSGTNGEGQLQIGTADGSATTTRGIWAGYGGLGIGTTSPGAGLAVSATSTILGGPVYALDHVRTSFLIATSSTASSTLPQVSATSISTAGLTVSGDFTVESAGTSSIPALNVGTALSVLGLTVTGDLNVDTGTSTFQGIQGTALNLTTGGINMAGDLLTSGVLKVSNTGTSTFAGSIAVNSTTATSTFIGGVIFGSTIVLNNGGIVVECFNHGDAAAYILDGKYNCHYLAPTSQDSTVAFKADTWRRGQYFEIQTYLPTSISLSLASTAPILYTETASSTPRSWAVGGNQNGACTGRFFATTTANARIGCTGSVPLTNDW